MPITDVAFASGFTSVRQFNATVLESAHATPSQLRAGARRTIAPRTRPDGGPGGAADGPGTWLALRLACREPFGSAGLLATVFSALATLFSNEMVGEIRGETFAPVPAREINKDTVAPPVV